jgi:uncharacterized protein (UPF0128 family)
MTPTHTLILSKNNQHIKYWESKWPREVGDIISFEGSKYKVVELLKDKDEARMSFAFLPGQRIFEHYRELFW